MKQTRHTYNNTNAFTLIELLIGLFIMSLLAIMTWRGLDAMTNIQHRTQKKVDDLMEINTTIGQWQADLNAMATEATPGVNPSYLFEFDGASVVLRRTMALPAEVKLNNTIKKNPSDNTKNHAEVMQVVAWTIQPVTDNSNPTNPITIKHLVRWQSGAIDTTQGLQTAWYQGKAWAKHNENNGSVGTTQDANNTTQAILMAVQDWNLAFFVNKTWIPQNNSGSTTVVGNGTGNISYELPIGIRLSLSDINGNLVEHKWISPSK